MQRKLTKKLNNSLHQHVHEDEEAVIPSRVGHTHRRQQSPIQVPQGADLEDENDDEPQHRVPQKQSRIYNSNPFTYYDRESLITSQERASPDQPIRTSSSRLAASFPTLINQSVNESEQALWRQSDDDKESDEYETENGDDDGDEYEPISSGSRSQAQQRGDKSKKATLKPKKSNTKVRKETLKPLSVGGTGSKRKDPNYHSSSENGKQRARSGGSGSGSSMNGNSGYKSSSSRLSRSRSGSSHQRVGGNFSHEVMPLPIEIPDTVTDADAFRRYLSVRRGATGPTAHPTLPNFEDHRSDSVMESTGGFLYGSTREQFKNLTHSHIAAAGFLVQRRSMALSHAIMTLALLSASASQLRFVVAYSNAHSYPALNYFLICSCILVEIMVGIGYVVISRFEFSEQTLDKTNTYLIFGLFFVAIANVIIAAFALDDHVCEVLAVLAKKNEREQFDLIDQSPVPPRHPIT